MQVFDAAGCPIYNGDILVIFQKKRPGRILVAKECEKKKTFIVRGEMIDPEYSQSTWQKESVSSHSSRIHTVAVVTERFKSSFLALANPNIQHMVVDKHKSLWNGKFLKSVRNPTSKTSLEHKFERMLKSKINKLQRGEPPLDSYIDIFYKRPPSSDTWHRSRYTPHSPPSFFVYGVSNRFYNANMSMNYNWTHMHANIRYTVMISVGTGFATASIREGSSKPYLHNVYKYPDDINETIQGHQLFQSDYFQELIALSKAMCNKHLDDYIDEMKRSRGITISRN